MEAKDYLYCVELRYTCCGASYRLRWCDDDLADAVLKKI